MIASYPGPPFNFVPFNFARGCVKIRHTTSLSTSVGVSMETHPWPSSSLVQVLQ